MADKRFNTADQDQVWIRDSDVPGPTTVIFGGIHGDEAAGAEIIRQMVSDDIHIPLEAGKLVVALGNPKALKKRARFIGTNLNREFIKLPPEQQAQRLEKPSYEFTRAQALMPLLDEADAVLDLHNFRPKDGHPFIITEERGFTAARAIGAPYISSGWSTIEVGGTDGYMESLGKIGLCYELSQLADLKNGLPRGERGVLRFLDHMAQITLADDSEPRNPTYVHASHAALANEGYEWGPGYPYKSFQQLAPGELIARNGSNPDNAVYAGTNQVIIFPSNEVKPKPGEEMFNLGTTFDPTNEPKTNA